MHSKVVNCEQDSLSIEINKFKPLMFILLAIVIVAFTLNVNATVRPEHHPVEFVRDTLVVQSLAYQPYSGPV